MKILSLCFCNDYFPDHENTLIDIKLGTDVLTLDPGSGKEFDFILAAPPYDIFTKASSWMWKKTPLDREQLFTFIAGQCLQICVNSGKPWILENPPGRIHYFIPDLIQYRRLTFQDTYSNKEYVLYSNMLLTQNYNSRYGKVCKPNGNLTKNQREMWTPGLVELVKSNFNL